MEVTTSSVDHADVDLRESQSLYHGQYLESSKIIDKKSLYDLLDMCIAPCLGHRGLREGRRKPASC